MLSALLFSSLALATDPQVCADADTHYDSWQEWYDNGHPIPTYTTDTPYSFVSGAGAGAVDWNGSAFTSTAMAGIMSQGPSGHTLDSYGHFEDGSVAIDRFIWFWEHDNTTGKKSLWVLTDYTITGDSRPIKYGTWNSVYRIAQSEAPGSGSTWPTITAIADAWGGDVTTYVRRVNDALKNGAASNALTTLAKANCAQTYGSTYCNARTWHGVNRNVVIYPFSGGQTLEQWVAAQGNADVYDHSATAEGPSESTIFLWVLTLWGCTPSICGGYNGNGNNDSFNCSVACSAAGVSCGSGTTRSCTYKRESNGQCVVDQCVGCVTTPGYSEPDGGVITE